MRRNLVLLLAPALFWGASLALNVDAEEADAAKGKQIYEIYCQSCHGPAGDGQGPIGKALDPAPRDFTRGEFKFGSKDGQIFKIIRDGTGSKDMESFSDRLKDEDMWNLVHYVKRFSR